MTTNGAVDTTGAFPRVWDLDMRASRMPRFSRRLASVVPAVQGRTLSAAGYGSVGEADITALAITPGTTPFVATTLVVTQFRTARPPV